MQFRVPREHVAARRITRSFTEGDAPSYYAHSHQRLVLHRGCVESRVVFGDNLLVLRSLATESVDLIYIDPPFNTGRAQARTHLRTVRDGEGDRVGFGGRRYRSVAVGTRSFDDSFDDFLAFLEPRLIEAHRVLRATGSLYFHIDYREAHYCKVLLDRIFGRASFLNEIIWAYDYGARTNKKWPPKHDNIFFYAKDPLRYVFNTEAIDRIPYMAPGLVTKEKAERGKLPTDTWWHTIVSPTGKEKLGYPTQKPLGILRRIVLASSNPGDVVLDFFAGSGTAGEAALQEGRACILIDNNEQAIAVMQKRFEGRPEVRFERFEPSDSATSRPREASVSQAHPRTPMQRALEGPEVYTVAPVPSGGYRVYDLHGEHVSSVLPTQEEAVQRAEELSRGAAEAAVRIQEEFLE